MKNLLKKMFILKIVMFSLFSLLIWTNTGISQEKKSRRIYGGYTQVPVKVSGYKNAVLNDYHFFGSGYDSAFLEFENGNVDSTMTGLLVGYQWILLEQHSIFLEASFISEGSVSGPYMNSDINILSSLMILIFPLSLKSGPLL